MSGEAAAPAVPEAATMKLKKTSAKPKVAAAHPPFAVMIAAAVKALKERNGSSRQAILKYVLRFIRALSRYHDKVSPFKKLCLVKTKFKFKKM